MTRYARVEGGVVLELIDTDQDPAVVYHPSLIWIACGQEVQEGWLHGASGFEPQASDDQVSHQALQGQARARLAESDQVYVRCGKAGVTYPAEWLAYDEVLRAVVRAQAPGTAANLPDRPDYPAGT